MESVNLKKIKKIHFIGIGGIGLSAIAKLMKKEGKEISGSDLSASLITKKLEEAGVKVFISQSEKNISEDLDLVIYTMAIPENNPELQKAKKLKIKAITYPQSLGLIFNNKLGIAVCGTHGKSTTTAMAGLLLEDAGFDPTIIVGSIVPRYNSNLRIGKSKYMAIEACEYEKAFLNYCPKIIILNNIELDHADYYKDINDYRSAFEEFISRLPEYGTLICNGDDGEISKLKVQISNQFQSSNVKNIYSPPNKAGLGRVNKRRIVSFGLNKGNNVRACDVKLGDGITRFKVAYNDKDLGEFVLKIPGMFNVYNSLAAISLGIALNISSDIIKKSLENYKGIWRRFEIKGKYKPAAASAKLWQGKSAKVISDYAHHPTAVKATIEAARQFYPKRRIFAVFQPHQHNRTKKLYSDFLKSFDNADVLILSEIFDVAGREENRDQGVSSLGLVNDIKKRLGNKIHPNPSRIQYGTGSLQKEGNIAVSRLSDNLKKQQVCHSRPVSKYGINSDGNPVNLSSRGVGDKPNFYLLDSRSGSGMTVLGQSEPRGISRLNSKNVFYAEDLKETGKLIDKKIKPDDVLLIIGAGDIYKLADNLTK